MITLTNRDAVARAIAWAKENPDKIIAGSLAQDDNGFMVSTNNPKATCFCLVGRVVKEMNLDIGSTGEAMAAFVEGYNEHESHDADDLWETNDTGVWNDDPLRGFRMLEEILNQGA